MKTLTEKPMKFNTEYYYCSVWLYQRSHSEMVVKLSKSDELSDPDKFYVLFTWVVYYEGPLKWQGEVFQLGSDMECKELLQKLGYTYPDELISSGKFHLYVSHTTEYNVRVIAAKYSKLNKLPS